MDKAVEVKENESVIIAVTEEINGNTVIGYTIAAGKGSLNTSTDENTSSTYKAAAANSYVCNESSSEDESEMIYGGAGSAYYVGVVNEGESLICIDGKWADWHNVVKNIQDFIEVSGESRDTLVFDNMKIKAYATYKQK